MMTGARLLIIDDNEDLCDAMCLLASDEGFEVRGVNDGWTFRAVFKDFAPDFILLDLAIPDEDGVELLAFLRDQGCRARVGIASSQPDHLLRQAGDLARAYGLDFMGALRKPFTRAEFRAFF
jgi:DNA-binding response OmpR family regulator